jgi:hypothetical protein
VSNERAAVFENLKIGVVSVAVGAERSHPATAAQRAAHYCKQAGSSPQDNPALDPDGKAAWALFIGLGTGITNSLGCSFRSKINLSRLIASPLHREGDPMDEDKVATTAEFLFRYMLVRHLLRGALPPLSLLADEIRWGVRAFDYIDIDPEANPPVTIDGDVDDFFRAIIKRDDGAMPDMEHADLARNRVCC